MTTVFAISMVKNEADIIESFVRYHLNIFDGLVILDNGSTDNTVNILERLTAEGIPLHVVRDSTMEYDQSDKTTNLMYRTFEQFDPDIVVPLDADEFLIAAHDGEHPRTILNGLDLNKVYYLRTRQYIPTRSDDPKELFIPRKIVHTYGDVDLYKVIATKEIVYRHTPYLMIGNHDLIFSHGEEPIEREDSELLKLAHFSFRSVDQAMSKVIVGWLNTLSRHTRRADDCAPWEYYFNLMKQRPDPRYKFVDDFIRDFYGDSPTYVHPMDLSFCSPIDVKYTTADEVNVLRNLLLFGERLAQEYAELRRTLE